jgi:hypothetical protein
MPIEFLFNRKGMKNILIDDEKLAKQIMGQLGWWVARRVPVSR